jgi:hypothetical protein
MAMKEKKLDVAWACHKKLVLLQGNAALSGFGVKQDIYKQVCI